MLAQLIREVLQRNVFLESEFGYIKLRPRHETNPGEMKPHTSLNTKISRFSRLHAGIRKCVGSTNKKQWKKTVSKRWGFGDRILCFHAAERLIRKKKSFQNYPNSCGRGLSSFTILSGSFMNVT